jgi:hypothetical protein
MKRIGKHYWEQNYPLNPFISVVISGQHDETLFSLHSFLTGVNLFKSVLIRLIRSIRVLFPTYRSITNKHYTVSFFNRDYPVIVS